MILLRSKQINPQEIESCVIWLGQKLLVTNIKIVAKRVKISIWGQEWTTIIIMKALRVSIRKLQIRKDSPKNISLTLLIKHIKRLFFNDMLLSNLITGFVAGCSNYMTYIRIIF